MSEQWRGGGEGGEANKLIGAGDIYSQRCCCCCWWRRRRRWRTTRVQFIPVFSLFALRRKAEQSRAEQESENVFARESEKERGLCVAEERKREGGGRKVT